jgi:all-trans-retinol dehydrogenase (NAD+)
MSRIEHSTALITGGASGIGYLMGKQLLGKGAARLVIWDIQERALRTAVEELTSQGHQVEGDRVDIADLAQVRRAVEALRERSIAVDLLINNAGIVVGKDFVDHSHDDIERTMRINAIAPMHVTRAVLPEMQKRGSGHIVNIASAAGMVANPRMAVYCASKWAVIGWSESLRIELEQAGSGIQVTTVSPYYIDTGMFAGVRSPVIPILKPERVARQIVAAIEDDTILLRMPWIINLLPLLRGLLPTRWFDTIAGEWLGVYHSMSTFRGRA